jgi:hypothetical protein
LGYTKNINFSDEAERVIKENFTRGRWGYQKLSETLSQLLIEFEKKKPTLESVKKRKEEIKFNLTQLKEEQKWVLNEEKRLVVLEKNKFVLNKEEKGFILEAIRLIKEDSSRLLPNLRSFNNKFNKELSLEDFNKLLKRYTEEKKINK